MNNREQLYNYIRLMLGQPALVIELSNEQLDCIIDDVMDSFPKAPVLVGSHETSSEAHETACLNNYKFRRLCVAYAGELLSRIYCKYSNNDLNVNGELLWDIYNQMIQQLEGK